MDQYNIYSIVICFLYLILCFWDSFKLLHVAIVCSVKFIVFNYIPQIIPPFCFDGHLGCFSYYSCGSMIILIKFCVHTLLSNVTYWVPCKADLRESFLEECIPFCSQDQSCLQDQYLWRSEEGGLDREGEAGMQCSQKKTSANLLGTLEWKCPYRVVPVGKRRLDLYTFLIYQSLDMDWPREGSLILSEKSHVGQEWGLHLWAFSQQS